MNEHDDGINFIDWDSSNSHFYIDLQPALKAIDQKLVEYKAKYKGATILIVQSDIDPEKLKFMGLPTISSEFPYFKCPVVPQDNRYPALDWIRYACKNMTERFLEIPEWHR